MPFDAAAAEKVSSHISRAFMDSVKNWVDQYVEATGHNRRLVTAVVAKVLILDGAVLMGAALDIGADPSIEVAEEAVEKFNALGLERWKQS